MANPAGSSNALCLTGNEGLDNILGGGLPRDRLYLIEGDPGSGKTTLGLQFLMEGVRLGEKGLYITLSETREELEAVAKSHGWSLEPIALFELSSLEDQIEAREGTTFFHPSEVELTETAKRLIREVETVNPARVVFDSLSELRLLSETALKYRRQILRLKQFFAKKRCTVLLLDDRTSDASDSHVKSLAHGVIGLDKVCPAYGTVRRRVNVQKIRGVKYREGHHDYIIKKGRVEFYPRLVAAEHHTAFVRETVPSGVAELDALLGGGLDRGTSTIIMGPAGTGKSTVLLHFLTAAAKRGEKSALFLFEESIGLVISRAEGFGVPLRQYVDSGLIHVQQIDPAELSPGEFVHAIRHQVEKNNAKLIGLDSLIGYMHAIPEENFLQLQLHELFTYLGQQGVATITVLTQSGMMGPMLSQIDLTYLGDTVVLLRFFEASGEIRQAISVVKRRSGKHERTLREMKIEASGIRIGEPLTEFQGVLTGVPEFKGKSGKMLKPRI